MGLVLDLGKSAFLVKGQWNEKYRQKLLSFVLPIKEKVNYLGILIGDTTSDEAYAPLVARAFQRAQFMKQLSLTQAERVALLQESILPPFIFPSRAYFPTDGLISKIRNIYRTALCVSSWGLTLPILQLPPNLGGACYQARAFFCFGNMPLPVD